MKKVVITQSNYIPWRGFFDLINVADVLVLYDDVQYTRRDWRNRNKIKTAQGVQWITIPVEHVSRHQQIRHTRVADPQWNRKHWNTLRVNYGRATFFRTYRDFFEELYLSPSSVWLSEINHRFLTAIARLLGIRTEFRWSWELGGEGNRTQRLLSICKALGATDYWSGPRAKAYLDEDAFVREGIRVHYFDFSGYPPYRQLFGEFVDRLSIIDLIFNEGPRAVEFMKTFDSIVSNG